jgi:hypothetical protein
MRGITSLKDNEFENLPCVPALSIPIGTGEITIDVVVSLTAQTPMNQTAVGDYIESLILSACRSQGGHDCLTQPSRPIQSD